MTAQTITGAPSTSIDPFADDFLADPFPGLKQMRDLGPVFRIAKYDTWGVARHDEVREVLHDWEAFSSASGVGMTHLAKERPWRTPSIILEVDPPDHSRARQVLSGILSGSRLRALKATFEAEAEALVGQLLERGEFDGVSDLAEAFPLRVFPDAVGLGEGDRQNLLSYGAMTFNGHGPRNRHFEQSMADSAEIRLWVDRQCSRDALTSNGFGAAIYEHVDAGALTEDEARLLVRSFLSAGVDTTVNALGFAILRFARNPEQWKKVVETPKLARSAFEEVVRIDAPVIGFFRTATRDLDFYGATIKEGDKVQAFYAGAAHDPERWEEPERFDVTRNTAGHTAFGFGIHGCVGQMVARLEGEALLTALAHRVDRFELLAEPTPKLNNTLRGLATLPVRIHPQ